MFALRLGENPQCVITTTPKPQPLLQQLLKRDDVVTTRGTTFENADNLAESSLSLLKERYEGTTLGRQELYAEIIDKLDGALWSTQLIEKSRVKKLPDLQKIIVSIDPAVTSGANSDETGITVVGKTENSEYYVLDDQSGKMSPESWGRKAIEMFHKWDADYIVAEVNNGGDLVERLLKTIDSSVKYKSVVATRGKLVRAEPIASLYEQGRVHHMGVFPELESQMCTYTGERTRPSPDRLDALVWGLTELSKSRGETNWRIS